MGVHGLWELLAPVGRRVSVETLAGKTLAVDASIWMVQFMKAMRDEKGEMVRNAHLLGFFRRICKLLFLRTKPVFVFDGGTPALKRRTVIARRRQRENAQAKVRKTAEKLLLNHLKAMRLKELSNDIKNKRLKQKSTTVGPEKTDNMDFVHSDLGRSNVKELNEMSAAEFAATEEGSLLQAKRSTSRSREELDEMLAASLAAEENEKEVASTMINTAEEEREADEEVILPSIIDDVDLAVLAALPQSMQRDILAQLKGKKKEEPVKDVGSQKHEVNDKGKGKGIQLSETDMAGCCSRYEEVTSSDTQDKIDEMLAASIAAEENAKSVDNASTSLGVSPIVEEDGDYDEDEEVILPAMHGEVDPAVLASLPPSMQLDLLVQMRERLIAENRQKYQKVKKDPAKFSELQIQAYLKTVAFRREIDVVQKAAAGGGVGGMQTSRIASEANKEYIFSSSFTGDKKELTSARVEKSADYREKAPETHPAPTLTNCNAAGNNSNASRRLAGNEPSVSVNESIQTFLDERGRIRVSRSRAMGMRMTRDIQRNLDLMKEVEQQKTNVNKDANMDTMPGADNNGPSESSGINLVNKLKAMSVDFLGERVPNEHSIHDKDAPIEVSFEYDCKNMLVDGEDDIFANLAGGNSVAIFHADDTAAKEQPSYSDTDSGWEEGIIGGKNTGFPGVSKGEWRSSVAEEDNNDESEIEWEDGDCDGAKIILPCPSESIQKASRGRLEEESNLQEAIRRSLESIEAGEPKHVPSSDDHLNADENKLDSGLVDGDNLAFPGPMDLNEEDACLNNKESMGGVTLPSEHNTEQNALHENVDEVGKYDCLDRNNSHYPASQSKSSMVSTSDNLEMLYDKPFILNKCTRTGYSTSDANLMMEDDMHMVAEKLLDEHTEDGKVFFDATEGEKNNCNNESEPLSSSVDNTKYAIPSIESSLKGSTKKLNTEPIFALVDDEVSFNRERSSNLAKDAGNTSEDFPAHVDDIRLEEEMRSLNQECVNLENEQRRLERNAECVNSELFTECQELLQIFGLPYIIAPMEAEAQCAFLELAKLVDGVVTDDSDVFLFGARSVYKNIFDDRKYVETYFMEDIEKELGLTREKLVRMALLLGSDYTEGVSGIGIVNAIEVVNAFPEEDGFVKFRQWVESPDPNILGSLNAKSGSNSRKKSSDESANSPQEQNESLDDNEEIKQTFFAKHRNVSKNWHIPPSFPSETVISAYYSPQVDKSTESFTWGKPDHLVLRKLCWEKFGWTSQKTDELLLPVLKEYNKRETQLRLEAFYTFNERFAKIRSKRINKAVKGITGKQPSELDDSRSMESGRGSPAESGDNKLENLKVIEEGLEVTKKAKVKQSRKRKNNGDTVARAPSTRRKIIGDYSLDPGTSVEDNLPLSMRTGKVQCDGKPLISKRRGRGKGRGRSRDLGVKQGREKESVSCQSCETLYSSSDTDDHWPRMHDDISKVSQEIRRSTRYHKPVNYSFDKLEVEDAIGASNLSYQTSLCEELVEENLSHVHDTSGDAATDFGISKGDLVNRPLNDDLPRDCLESENLFCTDARTCSNDDNTFDADSSADYLKVGGGFCLDDSEICHNPNTTDGVNTATVDDTEDLSHCSVMLDEADRDKNISDMQEGETAYSINNEPNKDLLNASKSCDPFEKRVVLPENDNNNSENYGGAFSAMPFLRKRRKKY